jgi:uncharacterized protein YfaQ (DUF2300 family)
VSSMPSATMARLSPTSTMSTPAWSATWAEGKSCAVIMVMGSPLRYMAWSVLRVTGLRFCAGAAPMGECELHRAWVRGFRNRDDAPFRRLHRGIEIRAVERREVCDILI